MLLDYDDHTPQAEGATTPTRATPAREKEDSGSRFGVIRGRSPAMRRIVALLPRIAAADATVLVEGETGTGKGLVAEAIHAASARRGKPLVVVDCGASAPSLFESELFGHEKGAFTGANTLRVGAFESARGSTIFIDEIGELPLELQPKLLRALDRRKVTRVGGCTSIDLDVRVIAATNRDLRQEVQRGRFRADLFYRLNIVQLRLPSLAERVEDLPLLIEQLYKELSAGKRAPAELVAQLAARAWPGNVRELRNAIERMLVLNETDDDAQLAARQAFDSAASRDDQTDFEEGVSFRDAKKRWVAVWERRYLRELLRRNDGVVSRAAREANMDRNHLTDLLKQHELVDDDGKFGDGGAAEDDVDEP